MNAPFTESTSQIRLSGSVKTSSSWKKFWLSSIRGYRVVKRVQTPKGYTLGRLTYQTSWVLSPKKDDTQD